MKANTILLFLLTGLAVLLCACGAAKTPAPDDPSNPTQPESGGEPLDITAFSFYCTTSYADGCFALTLTREESGTHLYAEELFSGGRIVDTMIENHVLEQLGELAGAYHVDRWNGFDKNNKHVMDGSSFTLSITLADGSTISAHGSNSFPDNYSEVSSALLTLYGELMEQYAPSEGASQTEGSEPQ